LPTNGSSSDARLNSESKEKPRIIINATEKDEIKELKSHVDGLSSEVQVAVGDLKKSIADIRSSVSEMENPFNLLRTPNDEARLPPGAKALMLGTDETPTSVESPAPLQKGTVQEQKPVPAIQPAIPTKSAKASAYLDWIWDMLDSGLTAEDIRHLADMGEMTNYLPKQANEFIYSLALTAEKIRDIGYTKAHLLLFLYKAATVSKTKVDPEDLEVLIDITEQQLKNAKDQ
jgi:hypothetical protein